MFIDIHCLLQDVIVLGRNLYVANGCIIPRVPNAKEGRDSMDFGVYGMENIPEEFLDEDEKEEKRKKAAANRPAVPIPAMHPGMVPGVHMVPTMVPGMMNGMMNPYGAVMAGCPFNPYNCNSLFVVLLRPNKYCCQ